jgi:hypothetical protein
MVERSYIRHARALIGEHGFFIQGVGRSHPTQPTYHYTVGLQRLAAPRPEVIVFGLDSHCAAAVLHAVYDRVRTEGALPVGEVVRGLFPHDERWPARADWVRPEWVEAYAGMVEPVLNRRATDVPMLQLVLPDEGGRWPEDPDVDPTLAADQPLLAHEIPWQAPIVHTKDDDLFYVEQPDTALVAVPVYGPFPADGRYELLRAERVTASTARLTDVPWAADHVASGDVVQTAAPDGIPGLAAGARVMQGLLLRGPWTTRAFRLPSSDTPIEDVADLTDALWDLAQTERTRLSTTRWTLHVNTIEPAHFDGTVRPFVRDGLLVPVGLQSDLDPFLGPASDCPDCQAAGGQ